MATVLVVDDESGIVDSLVDLLTEENYTVIFARNGKDGLRRIAEQPPAEAVPPRARVDGQVRQHLHPRGLRPAPERRPSRLPSIIDGHKEAPEPGLQRLSDTRLTLKLRSRKRGRQHLPVHLIKQPARPRLLHDPILHPEPPRPRVSQETPVQEATTANRNLLVRPATSYAKDGRSAGQAEQARGTRHRRSGNILSASPRTHNWKAPQPLMPKFSTGRSGNWPPEPRLSRGIAFAVVFLVLATCGVGLRLRDRTEPPTTVTYGDIVRPDFQGPLPTTTDIAAWKSAFAGFALEWPESELLQTERPQALLTFDDKFDGYVSGTGELHGTQLSAVIGFEDDAVAWFTCYALGIRTTSADAFLRTCWDAAAVTGADQEAGAAQGDGVGLRPRLRRRPRLRLRLS